MDSKGFPNLFMKIDDNYSQATKPLPEIKIETKFVKDG